MLRHSNTLRSSPSSLLRSFSRYSFAGIAVAQSNTSLGGRSASEQHRGSGCHRVINSPALPGKEHVRASSLSGERFG